jgi:hypothetical protein
VTKSAGREERTTPVRPFAVVGGALLAVGLLVDAVVGHGSLFGIDGLTGFYAAFGLLAGLAIVGLAKAIGGVLKRPDSYYPD